MTDLLDDEAALRSGDPSRFVDAVLSFPAQLREGYALGAELELSEAPPPRSVVLCGMGGSAAAADVAARSLGKVSTPILVVRAASAPAFVDERDLVVCLSYSGETEETLVAAGEAAARGARVVGIAAGGRLADGSHGPAVRVPGGAPGPRAAIGWLAGAAWAVLVRAGLDGSSIEQAAEAAAAELGAVLDPLAPGVPTDANLAKQVAAWVGERVPVVWSADPADEAVAFRWKAGFNENAKVPSFSGSLPELSHHEVVGWTKGWGDGFAVIVLRREAGPATGKTERLLAGLAELLDDAGVDHRDVVYRGGSRAAEMLGLMATGDLTSAYHALARGIDPTPIEAIARLKARIR